MVLKGQFLERPTLIPVGQQVVLEGVAHRGTRQPAVLILPPPAFEGGGMDHVVGAELAFAAARAGHSTVRFNYRGVGASQGALSSRFEDWLVDACEAAQLARDNAQGSALAVCSLGASDRVALALVERLPVRAVMLVHPSRATPLEVTQLSPRLELASVVMPEMEPIDRSAWSNALTPLGFDWVLISGATRAFQRNLPEVGRALVTLLDRASNAISRTTSHS